MKNFNKIVQLNDWLRTTNTGGIVRESEKISNLPEIIRRSIYEAVQHFNDFPDYEEQRNDHSYGLIDNPIFPITWNIEYFDKERAHPSIDPSDVTITERILTISSAVETAARLNDEFRASICGADIQKSVAVSQLSLATRETIYSAIRLTQFSSDDLLHPEHEFGIVEVEDNRFVWKIHPVARDLKFVSPDPCNPQLTRRVMRLKMEREAIAFENDCLRKLGIGGSVVVTQGVDSLSEAEKLELYKAICQFDQFTTDNDPYGEHDFGKVSVAGQDYFWKIDYYDKEGKGGSEEPADPVQTERIMTIMLASEY